VLVVEVVVVGVVPGVVVVEGAGPGVVVLGEVVVPGDVVVPGEVVVGVVPVGVVPVGAVAVGVVGVVAVVVGVVVVGVVPVVEAAVVLVPVVAVPLEPLPVELLCPDAPPSEVVLIAISSCCGVRLGTTGGWYEGSFPDAPPTPNTVPQRTTVSASAQIPLLRLTIFGRAGRFRDRSMPGLRFPCSRLLPMLGATPLHSRYFDKCPRELEGLLEEIFRGPCQNLDNIVVMLGTDGRSDHQ
jgi:hypothetical protein